VGGTDTTKEMGLLRPACRFIIITVIIIIIIIIIILTLLQSMEYEENISYLCLKPYFHITANIFWCHVKGKSKAVPVL